MRILKIRNNEEICIFRDFHKILFLQVIFQQDTGNNIQIRIIDQMMENTDNENIYDKILEMFGKIPDNFSILEEQIDIKTQLSYFEESKKIKISPALKKEFSVSRDILLSDESSLDEKKDSLVQLANCEDVEAFRTVEKFYKNSPEELKDWTTLALQESRMTLESSLLDENQIIISTGLGGKGKKLRYFCVLATREEKQFTELQKKLVEKELNFNLKKGDGEIEKIEFDETYCTLLAIVPLNVSIKELITEAIEECNQIGNFVDPRFIITNVRVFSRDEIRASWKNM